MEKTNEGYELTLKEAKKRLKMKWKMEPYRKNKYYIVSIVNLFSRWWINKLSVLKGGVLKGFSFFKFNCINNLTVIELPTEYKNYQIKVNPNNSTF